jgi:hypothetical protein
MDVAAMLLKAAAQRDQQTRDEESARMEMFRNAEPPGWMGEDEARAWRRRRDDIMYAYDTKP